MVMNCTLLESEKDKSEVVGKEYGLLNREIGGEIQA